MIIDLILDRRAGEQYNARKAYNYIREEEECFDFRSMDINISAAMDGGTNEDVQNELCKYILNNGYNPDICEYVRATNWV